MCKKCGSFDTRKWSKNRNGSQRYLCNDCLRTFTRAAKHSKYFSEFQQWVLHAITLNCISKASKNTLRKYFNQYLQSPPKPIEQERVTEVYVKIDAQYYSRKDCIVLVKAGRSLIYWKHFERETFQNYLTVFFHLSKLNYRLLGVTSD